MDILIGGHHVTPFINAHLVDAKGFLQAVMVRRAKNRRAAAISGFEALLLGSFMEVILLMLQRSYEPVEVGRFIPFIYKVLYIPGGCLGFLQSVCLPT